MTSLCWGWTSVLLDGLTDCFPPVWRWFLEFTKTWILYDFSISQPNKGAIHAVKRTWNSICFIIIKHQCQHAQTISSWKTWHYPAVADHPTKITIKKTRPKFPKLSLILGCMGDYAYHNPANMLLNGMVWLAVLTCAIYISFFEAIVGWIPVFMELRLQWFSLINLNHLAARTILIQTCHFTWFHHCGNLYPTISHTLRLSDHGSPLLLNIAVWLSHDLMNKHQQESNNHPGASYIIFPWISQSRLSSPFLRMSPPIIPIQFPSFRCVWKQGIPLDCGHITK